MAAHVCMGPLNINFLQHTPRAKSAKCRGQAVHNKPIMFCSVYYSYVSICIYGLNFWGLVIGFKVKGLQGSRYSFR